MKEFQEAGSVDYRKSDRPRSVVDKASTPTSRHLLFGVFKILIAPYCLVYAWRNH